MNEQLKTDLLNIDFLFEKVKSQSCDYIEKIAERPTSTTLVVEKAQTLNETGIGALSVLHLFNDKFEPLIIGSSGPRYLGYVTGGATPASILGDWLATIYDQNPQSTTGQGDVSANIELETIDLLLDLLGLPSDFVGGFVSGATMSNFTSLAVARQWLGRQYGKDFAKEGISQKISILSATPHSSALKSLSMLGIGSNNIIKVDCQWGNRECIDLGDLEKKIIALKGQAFILISSAGTVNTVDFDDFEAISKLKQKYKFWWHIDGAFGGVAACSPKYRPLLTGWEYADSIAVDCHKWLNVPYENAVFFVKSKHANLQTETFQNSNAPYLGDPLENFSYLHFLPENSRRLKALPVWFSIVAYGKKGYQEIVENSVALAKLLGKYIESSASFELLAPVRLNNVCFTLSGAHNQPLVSYFLKSLNNGEKVFMTPTVYQGKNGIKASFVNWRTSKKDLEVITIEMEQIIQSTAYSKLQY